MEQKIPPFLKRVHDSIVFNQDGEFHFYIPEKYFDRKLAFYAGEFINVIGVMDYALADKNGKLGQLRRFNYPTRFLTNPYKVDKLKGIKLIKESKVEDYRLLRYRKGDPIIVNIFVPQDSSNMEDFVKMFAVSGIIPNTIPYDELQTYFIDNIKYNGSSYGIALQLFGILISELCRSSKNDEVPFRLSGSNNMHDFAPISVKKVAKLISAYSAITSENFNESIVYASMNTKKVESPLERVITGENI